MTPRESKRDVRSRSRRKPHATAKAKDWIKYSTGGVGKRLTIDDGDRCANETASTEKTRSIGFELQAAEGVPFDDGKMCRPDFGFVGRPTPACGNKSADVLHKLCFYRQIGEGWMRSVASLWC